MRRMAWWVLGLASMACVGDRQMTRDFGKSSAAWLGSQRVSRDGAAQAVSGLDSVEASIIAKAYRRGLDPKAERTEKEPQVMLLQQDERGQLQAKPLAPSVPKE